MIRHELTPSGNAVEATWDRYMHDKPGNVWYFGEFNAAGRVTRAPGSRGAGLDGAIPGVFMLVQPPYRP